MVTKKFQTPFGYFEVLYNGQNIEFSIEAGTYNTFYVDEKTPVHPDGCYMVRIETADMNPGDVVLARYSVSGLEYDSGDEHTLNAVAELEHFTIGIGCDDTDDLEELWEIDRSRADADPNHFRTIYKFPYAHWGITKERNGFEFHITDDPKQYLQYADKNVHDQRTILSLPLVWNQNEDEYSWEIVSMLTC